MTEVKDSKHPEQAQRPIFFIGPYNNYQDAFWYARPIVIAEQPDSCPIMLDNLGVPLYCK
ncbi:MAG: hypothetical protein KAQ65_08110 [Candidatus Thorarchaeota archaeon]|nr:hypothetical protein [Candidatus Thorarchaeota archaeon]